MFAFLFVIKWLNIPECEIKLRYVRERLGTYVLNFSAEWVWIWMIYTHNLFLLSMPSTNLYICHNTLPWHFELCIIITSIVSIAFHINLPWSQLFGHQLPQPMIGLPPEWPTVSFGPRVESLTRKQCSRYICFSLFIRVYFPIILSFQCFVNAITRENSTIY